MTSTVVSLLGRPEGETAGDGMTVLSPIETFLPVDALRAGTFLFGAMNSETAADRKRDCIGRTQYQEV